MQWFAALALTSLIVFLETVARHVALAAGDSKILRLRGVPVSKSSLYSPERDFECLDGSLIVPFERVNDDYCDCADGSDEPGTAACTNGSFYCQNSGHQAKYIPSSWINDGVCDCCDASDEYASTAQCVDNCHELGREAWLEAQRTAELAKEGNKIRQEYITKGKSLKNENQAKLAEYRASYEEAELTKKEREVVKKRAEERESAALEKYKPPPKEETQGEENVQEEEKELARDEAEEYFIMLDSDQSGTITVPELQTRVTFDRDRNGEVSRDEALFFLLNRDEITKEEFINTAWSYMKPFIMLEKGVFKPAKKEGEEAHEGDHHDEEHPDDLEEHHDDDEHDDEEHEGEEGHEGEVEEIPNEQHEEPEKEPPVQYDEETQSLIDEAREAREKFQEAERSVHDMLTEIRKLEERVERDYGPEEEFASLDGECFDYTDLEYVYTLCLFGKATQRSKSGGSDVSLGQWNEWIGEGDDKYTKAKYDRGITCWNGPARSTIVSFKCGIENKLISVSEPSRCEYAMEFETPALCDPNVQNVDVHDEL